MSSKINEHEYLKEAKRIFTDAANYDDEQLIFCYKLIKRVETNLTEKSELVSELEEILKKYGGYSEYTLQKAAKKFSDKERQRYMLGFIRWYRMGFDTRICNILLRNGIFEVSQFRNLKKEEIERFRQAGRITVLKILEMQEKLFPGQMKNSKINEHELEYLKEAKRIFVDAANYNDEQLIFCYKLIKEVETNLTEKSELVSELEKILKKYGGCTLQNAAKKFSDKERQRYILGFIRWYRMGFDTRICTILLRNRIFEVSQLSSLKKEEIEKFRQAGRKSVLKILQMQQKLLSN